MTVFPLPAVELATTCHPQEDEALQVKAQALARSLNAPLLFNTNEMPPFLLVSTVKGLSLHSRHPGAGHYRETLFIDFVQGSAGFRREHGGGIRQPLARAAGLKGGVRPAIADSTAGLGMDSFVLASLGCAVTMIERSPVIGALLADGLQRAASHPATCEIASRLRLCIGNACNLLSTMNQHPDTIYLDPMYPHRRGSALNKQEMRTIRSLVGDDDDAGLLLTTALTIATNRVVVKRPKGAPTLDDKMPSHVIEMKNSRFDVYLTASCR